MKLEAVSLPASEVAQIQVDIQIRAARIAYATLRKGRDPDALHDLRVALRRLHALLHAYREALQFRKHMRKAVRGLAVTTNAARDAEVMLNLYSTLPIPGVVPARAGVAWVGQQLRCDLETGAQRASEALARDFERVCRSLESMLQCQAGKQGLLWGQLLGSSLTELWIELKESLAALRKDFSVARVHRTRIVAKRLRYLCEPAVHSGLPVTEVVEHIKLLQTLFGDYRDVELFGDWLLHTAEMTGAQWAKAEVQRALGLVELQTSSEADLLPGLIHVARHLQVRRRILQEEVQAWLGGEKEALLGESVNTVLAVCK